MMDFRRLKLGLAFFLAAVCLVMNFSFANTQNVGVLKVDSLKVFVQQDEKYSLPSTLSATLVNKRTTTVAVQWSVKAVDTKKLGTQVIKGTIKDYKGTVNLQLVVTPKIETIKLPEIEIPVHGNVILPKTATVTYYGGKQVEWAVQWPQTKVDTSRLGTLLHKGVLVNSNITVKQVIRVISLYDKVDVPLVTVAVGDVVYLPDTVVTYARDGSQSTIPVQWLTPASKIKTTVKGTIFVKGLIVGYQDQVMASIEVRTFIVDIEDVKIAVFWTEDYKLPNQVNARMNDKRYELVPVEWVTSIPDFKVPGLYEISGKVKDYDRPVKIQVRVKSTMYNKYRVFRYSQKFNYFAVPFTKEILGPVDLTRVTLQKKDGTPIALSYGNPGYTLRNELILIPSSQIEKDGLYILTILPNTVSAVDGELNSETIELKTFEGQ